MVRHLAGVAEQQPSVKTEVWNEHTVIDSNRHPLALNVNNALPQCSLSLSSIAAITFGNDDYTLVGYREASRPVVI
jgi:hypothetical protein